MRHAALPLLFLLAACGAPEAPDELLSPEAPPPTAPTLALTGPSAASVGSTFSFVVNGANRNELVEVVFGTGVGEGPCGPSGACAALTGPLQVVGSARANAIGFAVVTVQIPPVAPIDAYGYFQAVVRRGGANTAVSNVERVRTSDGGARVRVVHTSPDAPAVDIYANGGLLVQGLDYLQATPFVSVPGGRYLIEVRPAFSHAASRPLYSTELVLTGDTDFTAVAAGFLGSSAVADRFRVLPLAEDWGSPFPGVFNTRIVHAGPDAPAVAIDVGADGSAEVPSLARFGETGAAGIALPSYTSLQVAVNIPGVAVPFTLPTFSTDDDITVIATGRLAALPSARDGFGLLALDRDGVVGVVRPNPQVYVLHASPDAPAVDIQAGGATLVDDLGFRALSAPVTVPPGAYGLDIFDASGRSYVTSIQTPELVAGERYLAVATGFLSPRRGQPAFQAVYFADAVADVPGLAVLRFIHAAPDAPAVQIGLLQSTFLDLTGPLSFPNEGSPWGFQPGVYDIAVAQPPGQVLFEFPGLPLFEDDRYFAIATGSLAAGTFGITMVDPTAQPWATITVAPTP